MEMRKTNMNLMTRNTSKLNPVNRSHNISRVRDLLSPKNNCGAFDDQV